MRVYCFDESEERPLVFTDSWYYINVVNTSINVAPNQRLHFFPLGVIVGINGEHEYGIRLRVLLGEIDALFKMQPARRN